MKKLLRLILQIVPVLVLLSGIGLGIAAIDFMQSGTRFYTSEQTRWPLVVSGVSCLVVAAGLVLSGALLARRALRDLDAPGS